MSTSVYRMRSRIESVEAKIGPKPKIHRFAWAKVSTEILKKITKAGFIFSDLSKSELDHLMATKILGDRVDDP